jgi:sodium/hydrogen antiporter
MTGIRGNDAVNIAALSLVLAAIFLGGVISARVAAISTPIFLLYAVLSLTVIRMLPVAISLVGTRMDWRTVAFVGWFGPRGLASIVFALIALEDLHGLPGPIDEVVATIALTVVLSVVVHGVTAQPLAGRYASSHPVHLEPVQHPEPTVRRLVASRKVADPGRPGSA